MTHNFLQFSNSAKLTAKFKKKYSFLTGEYNFISHEHPKWPDWKFLHMTSHGHAFQMNPITFTPYKEDAGLEDQSAVLSEDKLDNDDQIQDFRERGFIKLLAKERDSKRPQKKKAFILMLMRECFDDEGIFRYILINPIKFDGKRVNMSFKKLVKTTTQMCTDPNTVGLDNIQAKFLQKSVRARPWKFEKQKKKCTVTIKRCQPVAA